MSLWAVCLLGGQEGFGSKYYLGHVQLWSVFDRILDSYMRVVASCYVCAKGKP